MIKKEGSVIAESEEMVTEDILFTYSEEEKQQNEINAANAKLIFSPKFIPVYPSLLKQGLTVTEALIFGFIEFYKASSSERFYFTNEQIAEVVQCNPDTVSRAIAKLQEFGLIKTSRKVRAGGGLIRFVTDILSISKPTKNQLGNRQKLQTNNNKIKDNKIEVGNIILTANQLHRLKEQFPSLDVLSSYRKFKIWQRATGKTFTNSLARFELWLLEDLEKQKKNPQPEVEYADFESEELWGTKEQFEEAARKAGIL